MKQHITLLLPALLLLSLGAAPQEEDPTAPYLTGVKERFSGFEELKQTAPFDYSVRGEGERELGRLLLESGDSERKTGYAGPIPVALCLGSDGRIIGVLTGPNQETPRYLRMLEKKGFFERWNGMTLEEAAERQVDAVTRATYSSNAILHGVRQAAKYHFEAAKRKHSSAGNDWNGLLLSAVVLLSAAIYLLCDFRRRLKRETSSCSCCKN